MLLLKRIRAFIIRDFQLALSYRLEFFIRILWILGIVTTFFFISQIFRGLPVTQYEQWRDPLAAWESARNVVATPRGAAGEVPAVEVKPAA